MVNKKGFIKIVEATIAVMLVITTLIIFTAGNRNTSERDLSEVLPPILDELARNTTLRTKILNENIENETLNTLIKEKLNNPGLESKTAICKLDSPCIIEIASEDTQNSVFSSERIISASIDSPTFQPKKIRVSLWRKG